MDRLKNIVSHSSLWSSEESSNESDGVRNHRQYHRQEREIGKKMKIGEYCWSQEEEQ